MTGRGARIKERREEESKAKSSKDEAYECWVLHWKVKDEAYECWVLHWKVSGAKALSAMLACMPIN